jgi:small subunit ribosomal protein S27
MEGEERKLWFFENEDKIDLEIEDKKVFYPKRWFGKKKKPRVIDENYIPPDVDKRRN